MKHVSSVSKRQGTRSFTRTRFSLQGLLLFATLCTVLVGVLTVGLDALVLILLIETVAVLASVELMLSNLPGAIRVSIKENAVRIDGTWSQRRAKVEEQARRRLRWNLLTAFVFILAPSNFLLYGIHTLVIPLPLGVDAAKAFRFSESEWKSKLREAGINGRFENWQTKRGESIPISARTKRRMLWHNWPVVVGLGAIWIGLSFLALQSVYFAALRELSAGIRWRSKQYEDWDIQRLQTTCK